MAIHLDDDDDDILASCLPTYLLDFSLLTMKRHTQQVIE